MMVTLNDGTEFKINRFSEDEMIEPGQVIYLYWEKEKGKVLKTRNLVNTDSHRDIKGGDEDEEEGYAAEA